MCACPRISYTQYAYISLYIFKLKYLCLYILAKNHRHLATSTCILHGRSGTYGTGLALVARLGLAGAVGLCVAGMALGNIDLRFAWQAWRLVTSTFALRGRRGTWRHRPSLCLAGVALMALGWLWWRDWVWPAPRDFA